MPRPDPAVADLVARWAEVGQVDPTATIAAVVTHVAETRGLDVVLRLDGRAVAPDDAALAVTDHDVVAGPWGPWLPGFVREVASSASTRHDRGVHHTPPEVVDQVLDRALAHTAPLTDATTVLDPAVGGGAFLLAMAERLPGPPAAVAARLHGVDVDPVAVATSRAALSLWAGADVGTDTVVTADYLTDDPFTDRRFDLVVGNPPFLSQLRGGTVRDDTARRAITSRWPGVGRYVDDAAAFLLAAVDATTDDGSVVLVQPASVLGAADAEPVRARLAETAPPVAVWVDPGRAFAAGVDTVAIACRRGAAIEAVDVDGVVIDRPTPQTWAPLLAAARGVPILERPEHGPVLGDVAHVTAGFRDQYYGLVDAVIDDPDGEHPLVTSGSIDPLDNRWGRRPTRFAKRRFEAPAVVLDRVDASVAGWVRQRLVPKVLVASQTRVLEAIADPEGRLVPGTPVVSVEPGPETTIWHVAALLTSPVATAWLVADAAGTAMSADAVRVSASTLAALPLPVDRSAWDRAASAAEAGDVERCGREMLAAHGLGDDPSLRSWWRARIPT